MHIRSLLLIAALLIPGAVRAGDDDDKDDSAIRNACRGLPGHTQLRTALKSVAPTPAPGANGGLNFHMWATVVNRDGVVCAVVFTGEDRDDQWPGSRVISAQKANAANAFSLKGFALSTANLYQPIQPGGTLFGLLISNPVNPAVAYAGNSASFGQPNDPLVGRKMGGVNGFGGGLALYTPGGVIIGAIGVSGDTSCTDHIVAWKTRHRLNLDNVPAGPAGSGKDNIIHPANVPFGHPNCDATATGVAGMLPVTHPTGPAQ